jgi:hypothetical protein
MSHAMLARTSKAAPAAPSLTAAKSSSNALGIGEPDDALEQQADHLADDTMAGGRARPAWSLSRMSIDAPLRMPVAPTPETPAGDVPSLVGDVMRSPGQPLDLHTQAAMEQRFGQDLSRVRVHADAKASASAQALNATAYTVANQIAFGPGQYAPFTPSGRKLLAHELAHTLQSDGASVPRGDLVVEPPHGRLEMQARTAADVALHTPAFEAPALVRSAPRLYRQEIPAPELEAVPPEDAAGMHLPTVSAASLDPKKREDYIDRKMTAVGYGIYAGFLIFCDGLPNAVQVPESQFLFGENDFVSVSPAVYPDFDSASKSIPVGPPAPGAPLPYAYFRGARGAVIAPTVFSAATTPRIYNTAKDLPQKLAHDIQRELVVLALSLVGGMVLKAIVRGIIRVAGGSEAAVSESVLQLRQQANELAAGLRRAGKPVTVNLAGTGEFTDAINVNNLTGQQTKDIPNLIKADAAQVGDIFPEGSVDQVISNNVVSKQVDWNATAKGAYRVLKPGGKISISPYAGDLQTQMGEIEKALKDAGFEGVTREHEFVVTAVKR